MYTYIHLFVHTSVNTTRNKHIYVYIYIFYIHVYMYINPSVEKVGSLEKINGAMPLHMYRMGLSRPLRAFPPSQRSCDIYFPGTSKSLFSY